MSDHKNPKKVSDSTKTKKKARPRRKRPSMAGARRLTKSGLRGGSQKLTQRMKDREAKGAIRQTGYEKR